jgi:hypothetical protein
VYVTDTVTVAVTVTVTDAARLTVTVPVTDPARATVATTVTVPPLPVTAGPAAANIASSLHSSATAALFFAPRLVFLPR